MRGPGIWPPPNLAVHARTPAAARQVHGAPHTGQAGRQTPTTQGQLPRLQVAPHIETITPHLHPETAQQQRILYVENTKQPGASIRCEIRCYYFQPHHKLLLDRPVLLDVLHPLSHHRAVLHLQHSSGNQVYLQQHSCFLLQKCPVVITGRSSPMSHSSAPASERPSAATASRQQPGCSMARRESLCVQGAAAWRIPKQAVSGKARRKPSKK
jgi:hypothetical protein